MDRKERLAQIRNSQALSSDTGLYRPAVGDAVVEVRGAASASTPGASDIKFLLDEIDRLETINGHLVQHNQELVEEMENIRADFGGDHR